MRRKSNATASVARRAFAAVLILSLILTTSWANSQEAAAQNTDGAQTAQATQSAGAEQTTSAAQNANVAQVDESTRIAEIGRNVPDVRDFGPSQRFDAIRFGAVANDETVDNTAAVQRALDAAGEAGGGVVELPAGRFYFDGTLTVPSGVALSGTYRSAPSIADKDETPTGTVLATRANRGDSDGAPFIALTGCNSSLIGVCVVYPDWRQTDVPPVPYPPCVASRDSVAVAIIDCCLLNPYEGIRLERAHRHLVRNVTGYPIYKGLFVDECFDIGRVENVHFWPFGVTYRPDDPFCEWVNLNGVAFEFARTDWQYVANTFCFGYGRGYSFVERKQGGANGNFLGIGADSCRRAVFVENSQKQGLLITNGEFVGRWTSEDSVCLEIGEKNEGAVMLTNCAFWGPVQTCVLSKQKKGRVSLNNCNFVNWDETHSMRTKTGGAAIRIDAGRAALVGCSFEQAGTHLFIGENAENVVATGNQAPGGFRVEGATGPGKLRAAANEVAPILVEPSATGKYRVKLGETGDAGYLRRWYGPEKGDSGTFRWSSGDSALILPVERNKRIAVRLVLDAPESAVKDVPIDELGVFYRGEKVAELAAGANRPRFELETGDSDEIELTIRCRAWVPAELRPESDDPRGLGLCGFRVDVETVGNAETRTFDANAGVWLDDETAESADSAEADSAER